MFAQRDESGKLIGVWTFPVDGVAEEQIADDHPDVVAFLDPVPQVLSRAQTINGLIALGLITAEEGESANVEIPQGVAVVLDNIPEPQRTAARVLWLNFVEAHRGDPLIAALVAANDMSDADIDEFFRSASA